MAEDNSGLYTARMKTERKTRDRKDFGGPVQTLSYLILKDKEKTSYILLASLHRQKYHKALKVLVL
jgi:hypothetical protein